MSGHSKWSKVKHQKGKTDKIKGQAFTKLGAAITIAVREGGGIGDPNSNFRLRLAIEKARSANMPKSNIERAIERGMGKGEGASMETIIYEGFGPSNIAVIVETATDNRQRTYTNLKNTFLRHGGNLGSPGSVAYMFKRVGEIRLVKGSKSQDEYTQLALDVGGSDIEFEEQSVVIYTDIHSLMEVKSRLEKTGEVLESSEFIFLPQNEVKITEAEHEKVFEFLSTIEDSDDVLKVSSNIA